MSAGSANKNKNHNNNNNNNNNINNSHRGPHTQTRSGAGWQIHSRDGLRRWRRAFRDDCAYNSTRGRGAAPVQAAAGKLFPSSLSGFRVN
eukprot:3669599-Rhodomonas_salina.2